MRLLNFSTEAGYALLVDDAFLDLHNDYDFAAMEQDIQKRTLALRWRRVESASLVATRRTIEILFEGLRHFSVIWPREQDSLHESTNLSGLGFERLEDCEGRETLEMTLPPESYDPDSLMVFCFESGLVVRADSETAICLTS